MLPAVPDRNHYPTGTVGPGTFTVHLVNGQKMQFEADGFDCWPTGVRFHVSEDGFRTEVGFVRWEVLAMLLRGTADLTPFGVRR